MKRGDTMSEKLKAARMLKRLNQKDVAQKIGISVSNYCEKETGKKQFTLSEIKKLLELFDKKFEDLF